jgi:hypothetical protein
VRYLVQAKLKPGSAEPLLHAVETGALGQGSIAGDEYLRNMQEARLAPDGSVRWIEVCYCPTPLQEERPYWERYFELTGVRNAHDPKRCRDRNGSEPWACGECDCTLRLEKKLCASGQPFLESVATQTPGAAPRSRT